MFDDNRIYDIQFKMKNSKLESNVLVEGPYDIDSY